MHMDRVLKQGREYVEDVINNVRTCLWPDALKHPNSQPRETDSQTERTPASQPTANGAAEKQSEDELMGEAPSGIKS